MRGRITVYKKPAILDPEGDTVRAALSRLGFDEVQKVSVGKVFEIDLSEAGSPDAAKARLHEMAERLLKNPVMETATIEVLP